MTKENKDSKALTKQSSGGAIVQYGEWTPEAMEKESQEISSGGDFWKVPVGRTTVRFLPPKLGWPSPFVIQHQHFIDMPGQKQVIFCCPRLHEGKTCLACAKADKMETSGNSRDAKIAQRLRPNKRIMANVVVAPSKEGTQKVSVWAFGKQVYEQLKAIREDDTAGGNFLDPIKGFNISVNRKGTGKDDTKYTLMAAREQSKLPNMDWIEVQRDLRKLIRIPTEDQQKRLLDGEDPRDVWGQDSEGGGRRRSRDEDEDVIDVDDDDSSKGKRTAEDDLFDDEVDLD